MAVTFNLAPVAVAEARLPTVAARDALRDLIAPTPMEVPWAETPPAPALGRIEAISPDAPLVGDRYHGLVATVHHAFDAHRPLRLGPDHFWIAIEQGLAIHVRENAEALRERFVSHEGELRLEVQRDGFVLGGQNDWSGVVASLADQIGEHIGKKHDLFVSDFSTTGPLERTVSSIVLMDAMQRYFQYQVTSACGIPRVTLDGDPDDYRRMRGRVQYLRELSLDWWVEALEPVLTELIRTAEGKPDLDFWNSLYKRKNASGGPYITGWIQVFFPYCGTADRPPAARHGLADWARTMDTPFGGGPTPDQLPPSLSAVPLKWRYLERTFEMELLGGFLGVFQDEDGTVSPQLGWAVRELPETLGT